MPLAPLIIVHRWFEEVWNQRKGETITELLTAESICMSGRSTLRGPEEFRQRQFAPIIEAFPDLWIRVEDTLVEGNQVVVRWEATGTHTGPGLGFPGTGRSITVTGMTWIRVCDGKLMEGWEQSDFHTVLDSLRSLVIA